MNAKVEEEYFIKQGKKYWDVGKWVKSNSEATGFRTYEEALNIAENDILITGYFRIIKFYYKY
jgi:hypothetical protein